ncbi:hypothetical protein [uncultured Dokdonia sp.]|uniref:hypothetical protein n=1 Tax=uncultured Dokdonia sp. TaxID=575653 RepID=UPI00261A319C|nr:hypothetical protein [uncultured Dokdonia sp.]
MSKKDTNTIDTHNLLLHFGDWTKEVPENELLICISIALNHCVCDKKIKIKGYLITATTLYLVMTSYKDSLKLALEFLSEQITLSVDAHLKHIQHANGNKIFNSSNQNKMFTMHQLQDYDLIKLITGKDVKLSYHNPRIAYFKKITHTYKYCSVSDYKGVLGPVIVDTTQK